jgi:hypothetical protein
VQRNALFVLIADEHGHYLWRIAYGSCSLAVETPAPDHLLCLPLQGNSSSYYATSNSCLDSVLASRAGLPISLALLHAAVGEAAGFTVQLVGMPGHVITRALIGVQGSQGSAGTGMNPSSRGFGAGAGGGAARSEERGGSSSIAQAQQGETSGGSGGRGEVQSASSDSWMYVDVFNGGVELSEDELRCVAGAATMQLSICCCKACVMTACRARALTACSMLACRAAGTAWLCEDQRLQHNG